MDAKTLIIKPRALLTFRTELLLVELTLAPFARVFLVVKTPPASLEQRALAEPAIVVISSE